MARADVEIRAENTDNVAIRIAKRELARLDPNVLSRAQRRCLLGSAHGLARSHDAGVFGAKRLGLRLGAEIVIGLSDNVLRLGETDIVGEILIAAEIARIAVLPENPGRHRVDHQRQHQLGGQSGYRGVAPETELWLAKLQHQPVEPIVARAKQLGLARLVRLAKT